MKILRTRCNSNKSRQHWNRVARNLYDFAEAPSSGYYRRSEIALIKRFFGSLKGKKFLKIDLWNEVNSTRILIWAAQQKAKVYGLDISDYLVNKARENFNKANIKANLIACDMRKIAYPANYFDFVYSMGTIEHVPDSEKTVAEIFRVLKPGGRCIIGVPNKLHPFLRPVMVWVLQVFDKYPYSPERSFTTTQLEKMLKENGFKISGRSGLMFMPGSLRMADLVLYKYARPLCRITKFLIKPLEYLERRSELLRRSGYLIAAAGIKPKHSS